MISNNFEDYEVLSILGADLNSTCYKVKNRNSSEVFVWKAISYEHFTEAQRQAFLAQVEKQKSQDHPHLVQIYDYIVQGEMKIIYLVCEFCANGNLASLIHRCLLENEYVSEDFLWRILYQIACALKIGGSLAQSLSLSNIFVDANYKVKLFNNSMLRPVLESCKIQEICLGTVMFELSTLQLQKRVNRNAVTLTKKILMDIPGYYSSEYKEIIRFMFTNNLDTKEIVDAVLCHPTILLKSTQTTKNLFIKNPIIPNEVVVQHENENTRNSNIETTHQVRLENLKNREIALKVREERLAVKEHEVHKREKKVSLMERSVKEKMLQAELYLKRCREARSTSSGSSKNGPTKAKVVNYEHIDTSLSADCGDSSFVVPTSRRMNPEAVRKPPHFTRTLSDRRVQFKGHSPLKDMFGRNGAKERVVQQQNSPDGKVAAGSELSKSGTCPQKRSRKKLDLSVLLPIRSRKPLIEQNIIYEESESGANQQNGYRPVSWTEETKQHAFDLLRIMNQSKETEPIKHTYL